MNVDAAFLYELWLGAPWGVGALSWCQVNSNWEYTYYFTHDCRRQTSERMRGQCTALSTVRRSITCDCSAVCFSYFSQMDNVCACTGHALDTSQRAARPAARRLQRRRKTMIWNCRRNPDSEYAATVHETAVSDVLTTFITSWSVSVVGTRFVTAWSIISTIHRLERRQRAIGAANHHNRRSRLSLRTILARRPFKPDDVGRGRRDPLPWLCCLLAVAYYHFPVAIDDIRAGSTTMARRPRTNQCRMTWQACVARAPCASADQVLKARRSVHRLIST